MSARGATTTSSAVNTMGSFGSLGMDPPPPHPTLLSIIKEVMCYKDRDNNGTANYYVRITNQGSGSCFHARNHDGVDSLAADFKSERPKASLRLLLTGSAGLYCVRGNGKDRR